MFEHMMPLDSEPMSRKEEQALFKRLQAGEDVENEIVSRNMRFVVDVSSDYLNRGLTLEELIQEGSYGLLTAVRRFEPERGLKFITYAVWWIRQAIQAGLRQRYRPFRVPDSWIGYHDTVRRALNELGADTTPDDVAAHTGLSLDAVESGMAMLVNDMSLNKPLYDAYPDDGEVLDTITDDAPPPIDTIFDTERAAMIGAAIADLPRREQSIIRLYYGIGDNDPLTLEEIGTIHGITRERVRQLRNAALKRLRAAAPAHAAELV